MPAIPKQTTARRREALTSARLPGDVSPVALRIAVVLAAATSIAFAAIDLPRELRSATARNAAVVNRSPTATGLS